MQRKERELAPFIERALARKPRMKPLADDEIPELHALGRQVVSQQQLAFLKAHEQVQRRQFVIVNQALHLSPMLI